MVDLPYKSALGILCSVGLISSLTAVAGGVLQLKEEEVDFSTMPDCSSGICIPILSSLLDCGQNITPDCFCRKPNPLMCAWSVNWDCWNRTEEWYQTQCAEKPLVNLTDIPGCARSCFYKANICHEPTSNCLCSQPKPACNSSVTSCTSTEVRLYDAWYTKSCKYNLTAVTAIASGPPATFSGGDTSRPPEFGSPSAGGCLSKGATAGVAIGAIIGLSAFGLFLYFCRKRKEPGQECANTAPLGVLEMEDSSNTKASPDLVQPAPLVEAPGDHR